MRRSAILLTLLLLLLGRAAAAEPEYRGRVALITGSSSGLGMELAKLAAGRGMKLVLVDMRPEVSEAFARNYREQGGEAVVVALDLADPARRGAAIEAARERFGHVDFLFNNAGYAYLTGFAAQDLAQAHHQFEVNYWAYVDLAQRVLPLMRPQGGYIVNVSSILGTVAAPPQYGIYSATKHALMGSFQAAAPELAAQGIRVKVVCPAGMRTGIAEHAVGENLDREAMQRVVDGWEPPENVAREIFDRLDEPEVVMFPTLAGQRMRDP